MNILRIVILLALLAMTVLVSGMMLFLSQPSELNVKHDSQVLAPSFSLPDLQGVERHSSEWAGKVLVINFWASWCPPCIREIPGFMRLQEKYADQVQFIGIALDKKAPVEDFVKRMNVNYPILHSEREGISLSRELGNKRGGLPFTVIVKPDNTIALQHLGELHEQTLDTALQQLITPKAS